MQLFQIFLFIILLAGLIGILGVMYYNQFEELKIFINEAELNIDEALRKKFDILNRLTNVINGNVELNCDIFNDFVKLKSLKISNHEMDRKLVNCASLYYDIAEKESELKNINNYVKLIKDLEHNEVTLIAAKEYYNNFITKYNKLIRLFPSSIVATIFKKEEMPFFDGKNMFDEVYNDFKI